MQPREGKWTADGRRDGSMEQLPSFLPSSLPRSVPQFLISSYESPFACGREGGKAPAERGGLDKGREEGPIPSHNTIIPSTRPPASPRAREGGRPSIHPSRGMRSFVRSFALLHFLFPFLPLSLSLSLSRCTSLEARGRRRRRLQRRRGRSRAGPRTYNATSAVRARLSVRRLSDVAK